MKVKLIKDLKRESGKVIEEGRTIDVTPEYALELAANGYIETKKKTKKASVKKQEINE